MLGLYFYFILWILFELEKIKIKKKEIPFVNFVKDFNHSQN